MMEWIIAHNLGVVLMMIPPAILAWVLMKIEDKIHEIWMEKKIMEDVKKLHEKA